MVVTNLPLEATQKLKSSLSQALSKEGITLSSLEFIDGTVKSLLGFLEAFAEKFSQGFQTLLSKQFEVQLSPRTETAQGIPNSSVSQEQSKQMTQESKTGP